MILEKGPYTFDRVIRIGITIGLFAGLIWFIGLVSDVLIPFVVALLLAYLINPLVLLLQKKISSRGLAVLVSLLIIILVSVLLAFILIPMIVGELRHMGQLLSELVNNSDWTERAVNILPSNIWQTIQDLADREDIKQFFMTDNFWTTMGGVAKKVLPGTWGLITGTASFIFGLVGLIVIGLYLVFLLMDYQRVSQGWQGYIPGKYRKTVTVFIADFDFAMNRFNA